MEEKPGIEPSPAPQLERLQEFARSILDNRQQHHRLTSTLEDVLCFAEGGGVDAELEALRRRILAVEELLRRGYDQLRAHGARVVSRDPLTIAVPGLLREHARFFWLDGGMAHVAFVVPRPAPGQPRR